MTRPRLLDLGCGAGGATRGYQQAGFHVTGVDIAPQPHYCGDEFVQADALTVPLDGFDAIHASMPCQRWANVTAWRGRPADHLDLLTPLRARLLTEATVPWVLENVPEAPLRRDMWLCGSQFGLTVRRHRIFEMSHPTLAMLPPCHHHRGLRPFEHKGERAFADAMGCTWMTNREAREAIPPAYTTFVGEFLMLQIPGAAVVPSPFGPPPVRAVRGSRRARAAAPAHPQQGP